MMDERFLWIVRYLDEEGREVPVRELAERMDVSARTVRNILSQNTDQWNNGGFLLQRSLTGVSIRVKDKDRLRRFLSAGTSGGFDNTSRLNHMLWRLLQKGGYLRIEELAEEMNVSRATLDRLMPELKAVAAEYNLTVVSRPKYGIRLDGTEVNKRICYAHRVRSRILEDDEALTKRVQEILLAAIQNNGLVLGDINFYNLVQHCVIALRRIASDNRLDETSPLQTGEETEEEIAAERRTAREIVERLETEFRVDIPAGEEQYIVMHLLGKRVLDRSHTITDEVLECIDAIFAEIKEKKGIDLTGDTELRAALALHVQPLLSRLRYGLKQDNPILSDIKREMTAGYELALCAVSVIERLFGYRMNEDEAGYLALHFTVAMERRETGTRGKKIAVVCASGRGTARLIVYRLTKRYHFRQEDLILTSALLLDTLNMSELLCILSTIPLTKEYPVPVILIDLAMSEQSMERVDRFLAEGGRNAEQGDGGEGRQAEILDGGKDRERRGDTEIFCFPDQRLGSREEVLNFLCGHLEEKEGDGIPADFRSQVFRREELSSTEVGGSLALPHPYQYDGKKTLLAVLTLRKPVRWKYNTVRLVILMAFPMEESEESRRLNDAVAALACDREAQRRLLESRDETAVRSLLLG